MRGLSKKNEELRKKEWSYALITWLSLHGLLIVSVIQMFRRSIRGITTFIFASVLVLFSVGLIYSLYALLDLRPPLSGNVEVSIGYSCYLIIAAAVGMLGEQFYFWTTRNEVKVVKETADTLDDLV